jgi:hypothetical protein
MIVRTLALSGLGLALFPDFASEHLLEITTPNDFWTTEQTEKGLAELGWPAARLAWLYVVVEVGYLLTGVAFGLFFLLRTGNTWFGLYLAFLFSGMGQGNLITEPALARLPALMPIAAFMGSVGWQLAFFLFYLFPNGRFVPRWTRWMPFAWLLANLLNGFENPPVGMVLVMTALGSQVYRYFWRSTPLERQQTKLLVAVVALFIPFLLFVVPPIFQPPPEDALGTALVWAVIGNILFRGVFLLVPAAIIVAIVRYRLWDVDVVIRKTLVYGLVTGLLALLYLGSVLLLQTAFGQVVDEESPLIIVVSTLLIAALFGPLRRRLQEIIDRRFYRQKYDAQQVLARFAQTARDEVGLDELSVELARVVEQTMRPERASVWLRGGHARQPATVAPVEGS